MSKEQKSFRASRHSKSSISWSAAGETSLKAVISGITESGGAIMFSRTIDGGALVLSIFSGDDRSKEYCTEAGELPDLLAWALETYS